MPFTKWKKNLKRQKKNEIIDAATKTQQLLLHYFMCLHILDWKK